jgi:transcriptional regulator with XRE-family HTH domain
MVMPVVDRRANKAAGEGGVPQFSFWLFIEALQDAKNGEGMAPAVLAEEMGASHEAVARWMAGIAVPKPGYLKQAARILGKEPSDFYE